MQIRTRTGREVIDRRAGERHRSGRAGWLRAAVLGADDGLLSTASLIIGVAAAHPDKGAVLVAGIAGLLAGALSMAAGEYVSVSSQRDSEQADLHREALELSSDPDAEIEELAGIYVGRGVEPELAAQVARQLMAKDALAAHARDELGMSDLSVAKPLQAALASAASFAVGAAGPLAFAATVSSNAIIPTITASTLALLALLGVAGARVGGSNIMPAMIRVTAWGALAMAVTAGLGRALGTVI